MADAVQAPATAEGPTSHTQNQVAKTAGALAIRPDQTTWTHEQSAVLRQSGISDDVTPAELSGFLHLCQRTGLDPFSRQIYLIGRKDKRAGRVVYTPQTGIDGYRVVARRATAKSRGTYGYEDTLWCDTSGRWRDVWLAEEPPAAAKVTVLRDGQKYSAVALYREYVQTGWENKPIGMWGKMPASQLAKCAEALALRKAFPHDLAGVYTAEEMAQADNPAPSQGAPERPAEPPRDFIAEAQSAETADMVRIVWQNAKRLSAPGEVLNRIAEIGQEKAAAEQQPTPQPDAATDDIVEAEVLAENDTTPETPASSHEPDRLEKLVNAVRNGWNNELAMEQNLAEGTQFGLLDINMPTPDGPQPLGEVINNRIATLKAQAVERNAA